MAASGGRFRVSYVVSHSTFCKRRMRESADQPAEVGPVRPAATGGEPGAAARHLERREPAERGGQAAPRNKLGFALQLCVLRTPAARWLRASSCRRPSWVRRPPARPRRGRARRLRGAVRDPARCRRPRSRRARARRTPGPSPPTPRRRRPSARRTCLGATQPPPFRPPTAFGCGRASRRSARQVRSGGVRCCSPASPRPGPSSRNTTTRLRSPPGAARYRGDRVAVDAARPVPTGAGASRGPSQLLALSHLFRGGAARLTCGGGGSVVPKTLSAPPGGGDGAAARDQRARPSARRVRRRVGAETTPPPGNDRFCSMMRVVKFRVRDLGRRFLVRCREQPVLPERWPPGCRGSLWTTTRCEVLLASWSS